VTGHNKRIVAALHALVPVVFGFEHVEGYGNVSALDLAVFANTQHPQYEHVNIVDQFFLLLLSHPHYASLPRGDLVTQSRMTGAYDANGSNSKPRRSFAGWGSGTLCHAKR